MSSVPCKMMVDDVGCAALDGGVDGVALGIAAHGGVVAVDVRQLRKSLR